MLRPGVQIKPVKGDALLTDRNFHDMRSNLLIEAVAVHAKIIGRIPESDESREKAAARFLTCSASHFDSLVQ